MTLSPLEAALLAAVVALISITVTVLAIMWRNDDKYVSKEFCGKIQENRCAEKKAEDDKRRVEAEDRQKELTAVIDRLKGLKDDQQTIFRMLRALVVNSSMTKEKQEEILNDRG